MRRTVGKEEAQQREEGMAWHDIEGHRVLRLYANKSVQLPMDTRNPKVRYSKDALMHKPLTSCSESAPSGLAVYTTLNLDQLDTWGYEEGRWVK